MLLKTFKGGIHPGDRKELTNSVPISVCPPPKEVIIPLRQHIGAPCEPIVNVGDRVLLGQTIGVANSFVSAPVHASVSGTVTKIEDYPHPSGGTALSIFIENDGKDELSPEITEWNLDLSDESIKEYVDRVSAQEIVVKVKNAGITGKSCHNPELPQLLPRNAPADRSESPHFQANCRVRLFPLPVSAAEKFSLPPYSLMREETGLQEEHPPVSPPENHVL